MRPFLSEDFHFDLDDGRNVIYRARRSVYQPRGEYQSLFVPSSSSGVTPPGTSGRSAISAAAEQLE